MTLTDTDIIGCVQTSNDTVAEILRKKKVKIEEDFSVPSQLTLLNNADFIYDDEH